MTVSDTTPPKLSVTLSPTVLWPPDHKLIPIRATIMVSDTCDPKPTVKFSITSNEPDNGLGDGDTAEDIQRCNRTDSRSCSARSEAERGNGRIYTVTYQATDASGNTTTKTATVDRPEESGGQQLDRAVREPPRGPDPRPPGGFSFR